jgi:hypothetical protein
VRSTCHIQKSEPSPIEESSIQTRLKNSSKTTMAEILNKAATLQQHSSLSTRHRASSYWTAPPARGNTARTMPLSPAHCVCRQLDASLILPPRESIGSLFHAHNIFVQPRRSCASQRKCRLQPQQPSLVRRAGAIKMADRPKCFLRSPSNSS